MIASRQRRGTRGRLSANSASGRGMEMNTIGKILVILNFIFALVVGGFLVIDFATRTNWKGEYDKLKREITQLEASRNTNVVVANSVTSRLKAAELTVDEAKQAVKDKEIDAKALED